MLWVENNHIPSLPISFRHLEALIEINIESNPITVPSREVLLKGIEEIRWDCRKRFMNAKRGLPPKVGVKRYGVGNEVVALDKRFENDQKKMLAVVKDGIPKLDLHRERPEAKGFMPAKRGQVSIFSRCIYILWFCLWSTSL